MADAKQEIIKNLDGLNEEQLDFVLGLLVVHNNGLLESVTYKETDSLHPNVTGTRTIIID